MILPDDATPNPDEIFGKDNISNEHISFADIGIRVCAV